MSTLQQALASYGSVAGGGSDPDFASVVALLHFNGTDLSTTITDVTGRSWTAVTGGVISTAQSKWGGASGRTIDNSNDHFITANSTDFDFGTGNFTVEFWLYPTIISGNQYVLSFRDTGTGTGWECYVDGVDSSVAFVSSEGGMITSTNCIVVNTWQHVAWTRSAVGVYNVYVGGVNRSGVWDLGATNNNTTTSLTVGIRTNILNPYQGHIDDLRITKGVARYTGSTQGTTYFTPATAAFPDS